PSGDGMPASGDPTNGRDLDGPARRGRLGAHPAAEQAADPIRLERESVADVLEGERPARIGRIEPLRGLPEQSLAAYPSRARASAERPYRVLEHRGHEPQLRRPLRGPLQELGELHRQHLVRSELARTIRIFHSPTETRTDHLPLRWYADPARRRVAPIAPDIPNASSGPSSRAGLGARRDAGVSSARRTSRRVGSDEIAAQGRRWIRQAAA